MCVPVTDQEMIKSSLSCNLKHVGISGHTGMECVVFVRLDEKIFSGLIMCSVSAPIICQRYWFLVLALESSHHSRCTSEWGWQWVVVWRHIYFVLDFKCLMLNAPWCLPEGVSEPFSGCNFFLSNITICCIYLIPVDQFIGLVNNLHHFGNDWCLQNLALVILIIVFSALWSALIWD